MTLTAGQHYYARSCAAISKHLAQTLLLVRPQHCGGLQVDVDVRVYGVISKVVLGQEGVLQLNTTLLQLLYHFLRHARQSYSDTE